MSCGSVLYRCGLQYKNCIILEAIYLRIFFLTDAFGILPPIAKFTVDQAIYHVMSANTSKIAGTKEGFIEPQVTFSSCLGLPFLPLLPTVYAELIGQKIVKGNSKGDGGIKVWLVNTG